jgi:2-oxoglutarate dehydrogenase complex dehydrogenase (E1) component-like enzyme
MSALLQFLVENPVDNLTEKVVVSTRLADFPFTIRAMTGPEFSEYQKAATVIGRHKKVEFNSKLYNEMVVLNHTVEPNFRDAETLKKAGCTSPEQFLYKSLLAGEIAELASRISDLSGFDRDMNETVEEAKNS